MLRCTALDLVLVSAVLSATMTLGQAEQNAEQDAFVKLQGTWIAEQVLSSGKEVPREKFPFELQFDDGKLTFKFVGDVKGKDRVHEVALDTGTDPFQMDLSRTVRDKKLTVRAIYKFDGERLLICSLRDADGQPAKQRPTSFDSSPTIRSELLTLKRKSEK
jgi:uncharacterized protein (TIGR03067 family)